MDEIDFETGGESIGQRIVRWFAYALILPILFMATVSFLYWPLLGWTWPAVIGVAVVVIVEQRRSDRARASGQAASGDDFASIVTAALLLWSASIAWIALRLGYSNNWRIDLREVAAIAVGGPIGIALTLVLGWLAVVLGWLLVAWPILFGCGVAGLVPKGAAKVFIVVAAIAANIGWVWWLWTR